MDITKMKNTEYDFKLANGETVKVSIAFYLLYGLRAKNKSLYERYNKILQNTDSDKFDILDMITIVYVGYVCAHLKDENIIPEEEFIQLCGSDMVAVGKAVAALVRPK